MNNPYDFHYWSKVYREERLAVANRRNLVERVRTDREPRQLGCLRVTWTNPLALLRRA
jgi:hypothetical protein